MKRTHNPISGYCEHEDRVEVFVDKKLDMDEIYTHIMDESTPWDIDDVAPNVCNKKPVDVIEIGEVWAQVADSRKYEPVPGGCQIQPTGANFVGTLGIITEAPYFGGNYLIGGLKGFRRVLDMIGISYDMKPVIVTNAHVIQPDIMAPKLHSNISQPRGVSNIIGKVLWSSPFNFKSNGIDAGIVSMDEPTLLNEIIEVGAVRQHRPPRQGEQVHKYGRTTKYTQGSCTRSKATVNVRFSEDVVLPFHNVHLFSNMSGPGDSGSIIVAQEDGKAVSLLFAGSQFMTIGCSLDRVEKESGVRVGK